MSTLLAVVALAVVWRFARGGRDLLDMAVDRLGGARRQARYASSTTDTTRRYRRMIGRAWLTFAGLSVIGLAMLGRFDALVRFPGELSAAWSPILRPDDPATFTGGALTGIVGGEILLVIGLLFRRRLGRPMGRPLGNNILLPVARAELASAALVALTAGMTEEVFFRLFLPLVVAMATGSAAVGTGVALVAFGAVHRYQGVVGIAATTVVGVVLMGIYLSSGDLWLAIIVHVVIDLNVLVLRPALWGAWRR